MERSIATLSLPEKRLALIHRVIVPDNEYPKEYAVLLTDHRSIFIRQEKTRSSWVLRQEMRFGTALVTDIKPKTLDDYAQTNLDKLSADRVNLTVSHDSVASLLLGADEFERGRGDFFVRMVMRRQKEIFQVYNFHMNFRQSSGPEGEIRFYAVPLGAYFKPRRLTQTRETILREYAADAFELYRKVLPAEVISSYSVMGPSLKE